MHIFVYNRACTVPEWGLEEDAQVGVGEQVVRRHAHLCSTTMGTLAADSKLPSLGMQGIACWGRHLVQGNLVPQGMLQLLAAQPCHSPPPLRRRLLPYDECRCLCSHGSAGINQGQGQTSSGNIIERIDCRLRRIACAFTPL